MKITSKKTVIAAIISTSFYTKYGNIEKYELEIDSEFWTQMKRSTLETR